MRKEVFIKFGSPRVIHTLLRLIFVFAMVLALLYFVTRLNLHILDSNGSWLSVEALLLGTVALILHTILHNFINVLVHDGSHFGLFKQKVLNDVVPTVLGVLCSLQLVHSYRKTHYDHHRNLGKSTDPDRSYYDRKFLNSDLIGQTLFHLSNIAFLRPQYRGSGRNIWILLTVVTIQVLFSFAYYAFTGDLTLFTFVLLNYFSYFTLYSLVISIRTSEQHRLDAPVASLNTEPKFFWWLFIGGGMENHGFHHDYPSVPPSREWEAMNFLNTHELQ